MKVTGFETWLVRVPYEEGHFGNHIVLSLRSDDGAEGIGYISLITPWALKPVRLAMEAFAEQVVGQDPIQVESISARLEARARRALKGLAHSAISAIDTALWDLKAKSLSQPLYRLLGGTDPHVPAYASWELWWQYDLETVARNAARHVERGFRSMKYRMGGISQRDKAVERTRLLRETVGPDSDLIVDINESWTVDQVIATGRELEQYGLFWIEDPVAHDDYEGLRRCAEALQTPICAGEAFHETSQFRALLDRRGADIVMIDLDIGGITPWLKTAALVESYGLKVASHLATEVSTHLVAAASNGLTVEYNPWAEPIFKEVPPVQNGALLLSERPGLGLDLDRDALEHFKLDR